MNNFIFILGDKNPLKIDKIERRYFINNGRPLGVIYSRFNTWLKSKLFVGLKNE